MKLVYLQLSLRVHLTCRGASTDSSRTTLEQKLEFLKIQAHLSGSQVQPTFATQAWNQDQRQDPQLPLQCSRAGPTFPHNSPPPCKFEFPANHHYWDYNGSSQTKPSDHSKLGFKRRNRIRRSMQGQAIFHPHLAPTSHSSSQLCGLWSLSRPPPPHE